MKFLSIIVAVISGVALGLGFLFIGLGLAGLFGGVSDSIIQMEPDWSTNDYAVWGLILTIVGYLGLARARENSGGGSLNG